jgi:hypothetical protein
VELSRTRSIHVILLSKPACSRQTRRAPRHQRRRTFCWIRQDARTGRRSAPVPAAPPGRCLTSGVGRDPARGAVGLWPLGPSYRAARDRLTAVGRASREHEGENNLPATSSILAGATTTRRRSEAQSELSRPAQVAAGRRPSRARMDRHSAGPDMICSRCGFAV